MRSIILLGVLVLTSCSNVKITMRCYDYLGDNQWHLVSTSDKYPHYFTIQAMPKEAKLNQEFEMKIPKSELEDK